MLFENATRNKELLVHLENAQSKQQRHIERQDVPYVDISRRKVSLVQDEHQREEDDEYPKQEKRDERGDRIVQHLVFRIQDVNQLLFAAFEAHFLQTFEQGTFVIKEADQRIFLLFFCHVPKIKSIIELNAVHYDKFMTKMHFFATKNKFNFCEPCSYC